MEYELYTDIVLQTHYYCAGEDAAVIPNVGLLIVSLVYAQKVRLIDQLFWHYGDVSDQDVSPT